MEWAIHRIIGLVATPTNKIRHELTPRFVLTRAVGFEVMFLIHGWNVPLFVFVVVVLVCDDGLIGVGSGIFIRHGRQSAVLVVLVHHFQGRIGSLLE